MRPDRARDLGIVSLSDLAREAPRLTLGSDLEFLSRPEWKAVDAAYGFDFRAARSYQPTFMYRALAGGEADVIRSEEHTSELQSLMRISYAVFCLKKKNDNELYLTFQTVLDTTQSTHTFP